MRLAFDIETDGLDATRVHCVWIQCLDSGAIQGYADQPGHRPISEALELLSDADLIVGHNILTYDLPTLHRLYPDFKVTGAVRDTLIISRILWTEDDLDNQDFRRRERGVFFPPTLIGKHKLEAWGYRLGVFKGDYGKTADWSRWTPQMHEYCGQDVTVTVALWREIEKRKPSERAVELEQKFRVIIDQQERQGFPFDEKAAAALYAELVEKRYRLTEILQALVPPRRIELKTPQFYSDPFGNKYPTKGAAPSRVKRLLTAGPNKFKLIPFNPGSADQAIAYFKTKGWEPTHFTDKGNPQFDEEVVKRIPFPEAKQLLDWLLLNKRIGQVAEGNKSWLTFNKNGRIHGAVMTTGTVTARCTHFNPNIAQVPKVKVRDKKPVHGFSGGYGWECRSCFTAEPGMVLVGWDASSLEIRCLAHYMAFYDGGEYGRIATDPAADIHTVNQNAAGISTRDAAKIWFYSYIYGAGDELLGENGGGITDADIDLYRQTQRRLWSFHAQRLVRCRRKPDAHTIALCVKGSVLRQQFEKGLPALGSLREAISKAVKERGYLLAIDGRKLVLRSSHSALNFLLQSCGSILVKTATVLLHERLTDMGWKHGREWAQHAHVHDEVQASVRPELADLYGQTAVQAIRDAGPILNFRIPLSGEFKIGRNWAETH